MNGGQRNDRPGLYASEEDTTIQNDADMVKHLHVFLQSIKAPPPYLLVGHSYGGPLIRLYTALYPSEVSGLVFIDPTDFMLTKEEENKLKASTGNTIGVTGIMQKTLEMVLSDKNVPNGLRSEVKRAFGDVLSYFQDYDSLPPLPDIPITVFYCV